MQVVQNGNWYDIMFDFNPRIIAAVKAIPGRYFDGGNKVWKVPKDKKTEVESLLKKFGIRNDVADLPQQMGVIEELPELTVDIPLNITPFPYQKRGIAYNLKYKRVIVGDEPGLGKTLQAIATAVAAGRRCVLVVCPSSLKNNWAKEFEKFAGWKSIILGDSVKNTWPTFHKVAGVRVFITNYESLKKYFVLAVNKPKDKPLRLNHIEFKPTIDLFDMVIIDELHRLKDGSTQQSKYAMGITKGKEWILGLTGTPVVNKPKDLVSQLYIIGTLGDFGGYKYFMDRYCGGNGSGSSNLGELNYKLKSTCFYQRKKKDVLTELPDKMRQIVLCDITTNSEYQKALSSLATYLADFRNKTDEEVRRSMRGEIMVQIGVCKNISARGKLEAVREYIDEVIGSGEKIGVFIHQKEIAQALKHKYPDALTITGSDSSEDRNNAVQQFQNNPNCKLILLSIKAAGVGLTLTAASRCVFVELPWHAADCDQCEDRFHRIGQKDSVQCTYFIGKDTIDEDIYKIIEKKRLVANGVMGTTDDVQKEIIDMVMGSIFNKKAA